MGFKALRQKKWFKILSNKYLLIFIIFLIWMFFFDGSSWLLHRELDQEIDKLQGNIEHFKKSIKNDTVQKNMLLDSAGLERFAREEYLMKKNTEEIYIIEYEDSIAKNEKD
ncbi:MAG: septum formation initiator family protein [Dokdonia sp.]|jgi:hypothetical protein|nr:septum formation initiator [Cytophagaceae bacterium]|tara:strand:+ start:290 stop:622 length:333 start_codon:yes stop_codon:yes gene_type:complete